MKVRTEKIIPTIGENKNHVPNHQPVKHHWTPGVLEFHADPLSHDCLVMKVGHGGRVSISAYPKHESFHDHNMYIYIHRYVSIHILYFIIIWGMIPAPRTIYHITRRNLQEHHHWENRGKNSQPRNINYAHFLVVE